MDELRPGPQILTPCGSARRRSIGVSNSPEFEFGNYIPRSPDIVCAAELFSGGVLLPLHRPSDEAPLPPAPAPDPEPFWSDPSSINNTLSSSMRWRDIFRKNDKKSSRRRSIDIDAEKDIISSFREMQRRERRNSTGGGVAAAELNINIWPFSRSRSAGNGAARPRSSVPAAARKVSSAPCSRSNSTGESKSRRWPGSPGRGGVHLGRTSPVCQVRRGGGGGRRNSEAVVRKIPFPGTGDGRSKAKVLSLNMPKCIGYRQHLSCKSDGNTAGGVPAAASGGGGSVSGEGVRGSSLFNIKSLFTKKVY
ncbi:hypothetical protein PHJA_000650700 [Phtheirospermum japonicum]|uniref:Uncharacterized protein n=1 Tax=Phtheirospermum japonicum TaxID=374723 RepID=A0A830BI25_9LAMI|nr:hypothetical protein PHJA_000650700 [Phtheirospermum japonicum]